MATKKVKAKLKKKDKKDDKKKKGGFPWWDKDKDGK